MSRVIAARLIVLSLTVLPVLILILRPGKAFAQGETTSAIVGQVSDASGAAVPGATVTIRNTETGLQRIATTDDSGRFNFPQLKPGAYTVRVEAQGFDPQQNDAVSSGLGQKQTADFNEIGHQRFEMVALQCRDMIGLGRGEQDPVDARAEEEPQQAAPAKAEGGENGFERQALIGKGLLAGVERAQHVDEDDLPVDAAGEQREKRLNDHPLIRLEALFHERGDAARADPRANRERHRAET